MNTPMLRTLLCLLAAGPMMKLMGAKFEGALTRLLGVVLAALAAAKPLGPPRCRARGPS